jgi:predicted PurR-regulated permease PerM
VAVSDREEGRDSFRRSGRIDIGAILNDLEIDRARLSLWTITVGIVIALWFFFWGYVATLILGLFVYYVTRPVFRRIHTRIHNRTLAVTASLVSIALPVLVLVGWTGIIAFQVLADFLAPETQAQVEAVVGPYLGLLDVNGQNVVQSLVTDPLGFLQTEVGQIAAGAFQGLLASLGVVASAGLRAFIVLVITFYLLRDDYRIAAWARRTFATEGGVVERYLVQVDDDLQTVFFGNILNALVTGLIAIVTYVVLNTFAPAIVRIPEPALVGLLVGVASLVPFVGIKLVTWPLGGYLLARSALQDPTTLWFPVVFFVLSFVVVDYIPDQLLRPYVSGRTLHVGAVMLAYLFGPILFGWYGIFLGPFLLVLMFEFGRIVVPWLVSPDGRLSPVAAGPPTAQADDPVEPSTTAVGRRDAVGTGDTDGTDEDDREPAGGANGEQDDEGPDE